MHKRTKLFAGSDQLLCHADLHLGWLAVLAGHPAIEREVLLAKPLANPYQ